MGGEALPRYIEEIMQEDVVTVTPETPVRELLRVLVDAQISGVPVVSDTGEIVGVVSATDVIRVGAEGREIPGGTLQWAPLALPNEEYDEDSAAPFFLLGEDWRYASVNDPEAIPEGVFEGASVSEIMTPAAFTVKPKDTVEDVARFLLRGRIHRALVVEHEQLKGIVTAFDLLGAFVGE
jgi:CBS domain-containing protein